MSFWETEEAVERFAARQPDKRLVEMLSDSLDPASLSVLDLGCAAGRNTVWLAAGGFDFFAVDSSSAMVTRTRSRISELVGATEAERRVLLGPMSNLSMFTDSTFDLVLALGVLHQAATRSEWDRTVREVGRVLAPDGLLLHAGWSPRSRPEGSSLEPVAGRPDVYRGFHSGHHLLLEADALDAALAAHGLNPAVETTEVRVETERGERITINGLYRLSAP